MADLQEGTPDPRLAFSLEEFRRLLKWAHEGLLVSPVGGSSEDDALFKRLESMDLDWGSA